MDNASHFTITILALAAFASANAFGQAQDTARLRTIVVSATKVPQPASTLSQAVTVISGDDLRARDMLSEVCGKRRSVAGFASKFFCRTSGEIERRGATV